MLDMDYFKRAEVADFGKIIYAKRNHTIPDLPDMNLLILKREDGYQAICIDIEVDAVGDTLEEACANLKISLIAYVKQMVSNHNNITKAAMEDIVNTAFGDGEIKTLLFYRYLQAKHKYILGKIAKENKIKSKAEYFLTAWKKVFQFQPIRFNLTLAAGIA